MKLANFTDLDGNRVIINADSVTRISFPRKTEFSSTLAKTLIEFLGGKQAVQEEMSVVAAILSSK